MTIESRDAEVYAAVLAMPGQHGFAIRIAELVNALRPWWKRRTFGSINRSLHRLEALGLLVDNGIPSGPPYPRPHERIASAPHPVVYEPRDRT